ncbi:serine/threonine-protein kinase [Haloactinospora alba]|uniref:non-specific serine/threonine protein kinase n=1 Tax=Haloactinospora alba TaxID=405555 RepID=A0A543N9X7_9ACTN|nr:serine/threonine-protein kinase [Haloactinospora alba]TQN28637.1 serine/threonine-protein kinase [Haloactinospora alba]
MSENGADAPGPTGPGDDLTGTLLSGRYRLDEQIGSGGMGTVWRATDTLLSRSVAVKLLHPDKMAEPTSRERFRTEGRITAGLSHPGIAQVYDYGEQDERAFLIMELVSGEPLSSILGRKDRLPPGATLDIVGQAAQALAAAHARGVIHRDMKPGNLLVTDDGTVKLTDFGIARGDQSVTLTQTGMVMGTAQYISPEQASGGSATFSSDIYALGVVAYECLAGRPPFTADTPLALALAHAREAPPPLPPDIPEHLGNLVERSLAKSPEDRPASAGEVAQLAQQIRGAGGFASAAATSALEAAASGPATDATMVTDAEDGGPATHPHAATATGMGTAAENRDASSGRLAQRSDSHRRTRLPLILAALAVTALVALGAVWAGRTWGGSDGGESPAGGGGSAPSSETSAPESPSGESPAETDQPQYDDGGNDRPDAEPPAEPDNNNDSPPADDESSSPDSTDEASDPPPDQGDSDDTGGPGDGTGEENGDNGGSDNSDGGTGDTDDGGGDGGGSDDTDGGGDGGDGSGSGA